jgi:molybdopterin/thiamine biosynthesis adenylyltransferase
MYRPIYLRPTSPKDTCALENLLALRRLSVFDSLSSQVRDLIETRHPEQKLSESHLEAMVREHVGANGLRQYGVWVYYPWSNRLVHLLDCDEFVELRTNRNRYHITRQEQEVLAAKRIGIVGLSAGQSIAVVLALERSCGELRLADFDTLELSNLNRVRAGVHQIGLPKVYVTAREIAEIDPYLKVACYADGLTEDNLLEFLAGDGQLDLVFDECDSLDVKVRLRVAAKQLALPVLMATSIRGMLDVERYDLEPARPLFHGLAGKLDAKVFSGLSAEQKIPWVMRIIGEENLSDRQRASLLEIEQSVSTWPQLGSAVMQGGAAAADVARRINLGQCQESGRFFIDLEQLIPSLPLRAPSNVDEPSASPSLDSGSMMMVVETVPVGLIDSDRIAPSREEVAAMVSQAIRAPSGGNSQPWRWLSRDGFLYLFRDRTRSSPLSDFGGLGAMVALGAAAETLTIAAHHLGLEVILETFSSDNECRPVARFSFFQSPNCRTEPHQSDALFSLIGSRYTDRAISRREPLRDEAVTAISDAVRSVQGIQIQVLQEQETLDSLGCILGAADRIRLLSRQMHAELMREIRWTAEEAVASGDGLDLRTLGLAASEKAALRLCRQWNSVELLRSWNCGRGSEKLARKAVASGSAVGLVTASGATPLDYFEGGRAVQRGWLTATRERIGFHPMTALPYLFARLLRGGGIGLDAATRTELMEMRPKYESLFRVTESIAEVMLFRLSISHSAEVRSLRRQLDEVLTFA